MLSSLGLIVGIGVVPFIFSQRKASATAPNFTLNFLIPQDRAITLSDIVKERPVLLVFWATWCPSCTAEIPTLNTWYEKYHSQGLEILAVNVQEPRKRITEFVKKTPMNYPSLLDENGEVAARYGLVGLPAAVFLARGGEIIYYGFGLPDNLDQLLAKN